MTFLRFYSCILFLLAFISIPVQAVILVQNTNDGGPGSFRQAIDIANGTATPEIIRFNIPGAGPHILQPQLPLPPITEPVRINGFSQSDASPANNSANANVQIVLDGSSAGQVANGLEIFTDNAIIWGLAVRNFSDNGIFIGGANNIVRGCYVGTSSDGSLEMPNGTSGISVFGDANQIGGRRPAHRNLVSANNIGLRVNGSHNLIQGNYIGTDITTTQDFGNAEEGILVTGSNNLIGGSQIGTGNVISGNSVGVRIVQGQFNQLLRNIIGTDKSATVDQISLGNINGVIINSNSTVPGENEIGGNAPETRNIISNNIGAGVVLAGVGDTVSGNYIGTDGTGSIRLQNRGSGVSITGDYNLVGGFDKMSRNIVSGNRGIGIAVQGQPNFLSDHLFPRKPIGNTIQANYIGVDVSGQLPLPNGLGNDSSGVYIKDADTTTIGGTARSQGNLISGNGGHGIELDVDYEESGGIIDTFIFNNIIGTNINRNDLIPNSGSGIWINGASQTRIGRSASTVLDQRLGNSLFV